MIPLEAMCLSSDEEESGDNVRIRRAEESSKQRVSLVVYLFSVSKEMVCALHLLTHLLPSYKNQSIDLLCKSIDWFLYRHLMS